MSNALLLGDCLEVLKEIPDNSIDAIVTDPPYGLSFMGKKWDYDVPSVDIWCEVLRVLKPGGHILSFGGTRTYHRMVVNIEDAGFEIRDQIQWLYGSGFPKSHNIKEGAFKGWGTALKPANEPICLARKPLEGTVAQNVQKWGTGAINVDAGRIGTESTKRPLGKSMSGVHIGSQERNDRPSMGVIGGSDSGRWPANIILDETAAEMLDQQSGECKTGAFKRKASDQTTVQPGGWKTASRTEKDFGPGSSGGASRFFYVAKASKRERNAGLDGMPLVKLQDHAEGTKRKLVAQAENEKNPNLPRQNFHPTVKPVKLMEYLIKLVTPPGGIVLDPFMGSGTTGVAAKNLGFSFIGIERDQEYYNIAEKRIGA